MADYAIHDTTLTGISNVIRKKEGSSALIDPAEYAERINLMGMLEKKIIVSSPICDFSDGSDDVPTDFVKITMPASLDGYNRASVVNSGKNLFDKSAITENSIIGHGTGVISTNNSYFVSDYIPVKEGATYYFTGFNYWYQSYYDKNKNLSEEIPTNTAKATIPSGVAYLRVSGQNTNIDTAQLELGASASSYVPYIAPTTYSANLGRTVHGAEVDLVNGEGESLCGKIVFDGSESRWSAYTTGNGYAIPLTGMKRGTWYTSPLALSYPLPKAPNNDNLGVRIGVNNDGIYVVQANTIEGVTDLASFKAWLSENPLTIIYPLDVTEDFTFTGQEIPTRLGYNCFISEQGDTSVAYRASGTIYQYPKGEEASF